MKPVSDFDYHLPPELIAQSPPPRRSDSRLLVVDRSSGSIEHRRFNDLLDYVEIGDCLVVNETRVIPARLLGHKTTGAAVEFLLLGRTAPGDWEALTKPARRLGVGATVIFNDSLSAEIIEERADGKRLVRFRSKGDLRADLARLGKLALPPYIHQPLEETERYQTVFAAKPGSVAAPTAGLHFTEEIIEKARGRGAKFVKVSLDIGLDTFRSIQVKLLSEHRMHSETYEIAGGAARAVNDAKREHRTVTAVGTTVVRALESAAAGGGDVRAGRRATDLFITPGYKFKVVDRLLTNFHLPKSTLLVLVSAFAGRDLTMTAYREAVKESYRFYSLGDAMLVL